MTDAKDPIAQIQKEEESMQTQLIKKTKENAADFEEKETEYEKRLVELQENLKAEGIKELGEAKEAAAEGYKKAEEEASKARDNQIREGESRKDQAQKIIEKTFQDFING